jgi:hypothetical protein
VLDVNFGGEIEVLYGAVYGGVGHAEEEDVGSNG